MTLLSTEELESITRRRYPAPAIADELAERDAIALELDTDAEVAAYRAHFPHQRTGINERTNAAAARIHAGIAAQARADRAARRRLILAATIAPADHRTTVLRALHDLAAR